MKTKNMNETGVVKIGDLEIGKKPALLCTVLEKDVDSTVKMANLAYLNGADCIELRVDMLDDASMIPEIIKKISKPKLLVCRPKKWDGFFEGTEEERVKRLLIGIENGVDAVDIELVTPEKLRRQVIDAAKKKGIPVLIAYENFEKMPSKEELLSILKEEERIGANIAKFAVISRSYDDTLTALEAALEAKKILKVPFVAIAMSKYGSPSRFLSLMFGASMTYCAPEKGKEGAPGQLPVAEMRTILKILE